MPAARCGVPMSIPYKYRKFKSSFSGPLATFPQQPPPSHGCHVGRHREKPSSPRKVLAASERRSFKGKGHIAPLSPSANVGLGVRGSAPISTAGRHASPPGGNLGGLVAFVISNIRASQTPHRSVRGKAHVLPPQCPHGSPRKTQLPHLPVLLAPGDVYCVVCSYGFFLNRCI